MALFGKRRGRGTSAGGMDAAATDGGWMQLRATAGAYSLAEADARRFAGLPPAEPKSNPMSRNLLRRMVAEAVNSMGDEAGLAELLSNRESLPTPLPVMFGDTLFYRDSLRREAAGTAFLLLRYLTTVLVAAPSAAQSDIIDCLLNIARRASYDIEGCPGLRQLTDRHIDVNGWFPLTDHWLGEGASAEQRQSFEEWARGHFLRLRNYAACCGHVAACASLSRQLFALAAESPSTYPGAAELASQWAIAASDATCTTRPGFWSHLPAVGRMAPPDSAARKHQLVTEALRSDEPGVVSSSVVDETTNAPIPNYATVESLASMVDAAIASLSSKARALTGLPTLDLARDGVVVIRELGSNPAAVGGPFATLGKALPLQVPALDAALATLRRSFPHAEPVIDALASCWSSWRPGVMPRHVLLVGEPGCGKSELARRFMELTGMLGMVAPCGGSADNRIAGTARGWTSAHSSMPVEACERYGVANPLLILDELEKVATSRHNGSIHDALLSMLEPSTAATYVDCNVMAPCDISHVAWMATANSLDGIPAALRDRFHIVRFPAPAARHLPALAESLLDTLAERELLDRRMLPALDEVELAALAEHWRGGSLRGLLRMVESVVAARAAHMPRH